MAQFLNIKKRATKLPNGHTVRLELVDHPGAVLIVPFLTRDKVILLRQFRPVINAYIFELPAGTLEKGEAAPCLRPPRNHRRNGVQRKKAYAPGHHLSRAGLLNRKDNDV